MSISGWMNELSKIWAFDDGENGTTLSFRQDDFPEALNVYPCALSFIAQTDFDYGIGSPSIEAFRGVTEFHIVSDTNKTSIPYVTTFIHRIRDAAAANLQLNGTVALFVVESVRGPLSLQYGDESPHLGLIVNWRALVDTSGDFTVSA